MGAEYDGRSFFLGLGLREVPVINTNPLFFDSKLYQFIMSSVDQLETSLNCNRLLWQDSLCSLVYRLELRRPGLRSVIYYTYTTELISIRKSIQLNQTIGLTRLAWLMPRLMLQKPLLLSQLCSMLVWEVVSIIVHF